MSSESKKPGDIDLVFNQKVDSIIADLNSAMTNVALARCLPFDDDSHRNLIDVAADKAQSAADKILNLTKPSRLIP